jgi:hypothetical protein
MPYTTVRLVFVLAVAHRSSLGLWLGSWCRRALRGSLSPEVIAVDVPVLEGANRLQC